MLRLFESVVAVILIEFPRVRNDAEIGSGNVSSRKNFETRNDERDAEWNIGDSSCKNPSLNVGYTYQQYDQ